MARIISLALLACVSPLHAVPIAAYVMHCTDGTRITGASLSDLGILLASRARDDNCTIKAGRPQISWPRKLLANALHGAACRSPKMLPVERTSARRARHLAKSTK